MVIDTIQDDHLDDVIEEEPEDLYDDGYDDHDDDTDQFEFQEKIIIPSPKVSIDENDIPIIVNNKVGYFLRNIFYWLIPFIGIFWGKNPCRLPWGRRVPGAAAVRHLRPEVQCNCAWKTHQGEVD